MKVFCFTRLAASLLALALVMPGLVLAHGDEEHGTNDSLYGGLVMMYIDLHFEVVLNEEGGVALYYSDAARAPLPAAVVSNVEVDIMRSAVPMESVAMSASDAGDYWVGESTPVVDRNTIIRITFLFQGEPVVYELPAKLFPIMMAPSPTTSAHEA